MSQTIPPGVETVGVQFNTGNGQEALTAPAHAESLKLMGLFKTLITSPWRRFWLDIDSRCYPVDRKVTSPDPLKPFSLNAQQVGDIWSLRNKF